MNDSDFKDNFRNKKSYGNHVECLQHHLSNYFSDQEMTVFHEILSIDFHVDVYFIKPKARDYNILLTSGMSAFSMTVDDGIPNPGNYQFAEVMVLLPKKLDFGDVHTGQEKNGWIISMLKQTARFPHHDDTYVAVGHTVQAAENFQAYAPDTEFAGCVILPSVTFDKRFTELECSGNKINIYSLFPLYKNELEFKIQNGFRELLNLLIKANTKEVIDLKRKNLIESNVFRKLFGR